MHLSTHLFLKQSRELCQARNLRGRARVLVDLKSNHAANQTATVQTRRRPLEQSTATHGEPFQGTCHKGDGNWYHMCWHTWAGERYWSLHTKASMYELHVWVQPYPLRVLSSIGVISSLK